MPDPGELSATLLLLFFGGGILFAVNAALYGGNVAEITDLISVLAGPMVLVAILVFFAVAVFNAASGR